MDATLLILAGGKSSRFGEDKAKAAVKGKGFIDHILDNIGDLFSRVYIVSNEKEFNFKGNAEVIFEKGESFLGPLNGLFWGIKEGKGERFFLIGCDMPFVKRSVVSAMLGYNTSSDALIPVISGYPEPLHGIYKKALLENIEQSMQAGNLTMMRLLKEINWEAFSCKDISKEEIIQSVKNINHKADLEG